MLTLRLLIHKRYSLYLRISIIPILSRLQNSATGIEYSTLFSLRTGCILCLSGYCVMWNPFAFSNFIFMRYLPTSTISQINKTSADIWQQADQFIQSFNFGSDQVNSEVNYAIVPGVSRKGIYFSFDAHKYQTLSVFFLFFLDALGQTGKTFAASFIQWFQRSHWKHVLAIAYFLVADYLPNGGLTAHSVSKSFEFLYIFKKKMKH